MKYCVSCFEVIKNDVCFEIFLYKINCVYKFSDLIYECSLYILISDYIDELEGI